MALSSRVIHAIYTQLSTDESEAGLKLINGTIPLATVAISGGQNVLARQWVCKGFDSSVTRDRRQS